MPLHQAGGGGGGGGGTLDGNGTAGFLSKYADIDTLAPSGFMSEDANGVNVTGGNFNSTQGSMVSMARGGAGHIGAICLNNTSGSRAETPFTGQALLTGDLSAYTKVKLPDTNPSANQYIWSLFEGASTDGIYVQITAASSRLDFICTKTGQTTLTLNGSTTLYSQILGQVIEIGVKRVGNVVTFYINGVSVGTLTGNACTVSYSSTAKSQAGNLTSSSTPFLGNIYANRIYNRALSDADFAAIGSGGVDASDEYGSQADITSGALTRQKRYRIKTFGTGDSFTGIGASSNAAGVEFIATGPTPATWTNGSVLTQIGCISAPAFNIGTGTNLPDRSPNGLDATITGGYTHTIPIRSFNVIDKLRFGAIGDAVLQWVSANVLAMRNGAIGQMFRVSGTYTDDSNFRTLEISNTTAGTAKVNAKGIGTGVSGNTLELAAGDVTGLRINSAGGAEGPLGTLTRTHAGDSGCILPSATAGSGVSTYMPRHSILTGDFTASYRIEVPSSNPAAVQYIGYIYDTGAGYIAIYCDTSGRLVAITQSATVVLLTAFVSSFGGSVSMLTLTRVGTTITLYLNALSLGAFTVTGADFSLSSANGRFSIGGGVTGGGASSYPWRIYNARLYRRALSAADVVNLMNTGVAWADEWDSPTTSYTSDFSAGTNGFSAANGTAAGNVDAIGGLDDNLRYTIGSGANTADGLTKSSAGTVGKRYRITFSYYIPSGQSQITSIRVLSGLGTAVSGLNATNTWTTVTVESVWSGDTTLRISQNFAGTGNGTDVFYLRGIIVEQIGCILDWVLSDGIGLTIRDRSSNNYVGQGTGISHTIPERSGTKTITRQFLHSEISSTAATTKLFDLPPNCGVPTIELVRTTAMDSGITLDIGIIGTQAKYASAMVASSTGLLYAASLSPGSESSTADTSVYIKKSGSTTVGDITVKITFSIRN